MSVAETAPQRADPIEIGSGDARLCTGAHLPLLTRLAEIGIEIAEATARRAIALAETPALAPDAPDPGLTYARVARAVRLTIALHARLTRELAEADSAHAQARAAEAARRRERVHRRVERAVEAETGDADEADQLSSDAWERLTDEDDEALLLRPIGEMVARICADLGLDANLGANWGADWGAAVFADAVPEAAQQTLAPGRHPAWEGGRVARPPPSPPVWPPPPDAARSGASLARSAPRGARVQRVPGPFPVGGQQV